MLKGRASLLASFEATGWQKHLPGEKDDGTIKKKFTSILDLVRTHIDGFYGAGAESSKEVHLNESFSNDILEAIQRQGVSSLLLEAAMLRLIVHMISLRSDPRDSLLPADFTTIPAEQGWHMEIDGRHDRRDVESTKGKSGNLAKFAFDTNTSRLAAGVCAVAKTDYFPSQWLTYRESIQRGARRQA